MYQKLVVCMFLCALASSLLSPIAGALDLFGEPGLSATYEIATHNADAVSVVGEFHINIGPSATWNEKAGQWIQWEARKKNGERFRVWMLCDGYPSKVVGASDPHVLRYLFQEGESQPVEYRHGVTQRAVLPGSGAWPYLFPRAKRELNALDVLPESVDYLGHTYTRTQRTHGAPEVAPQAEVHLLRPDALSGVPHNTRQVDETRRYDESDYEYIPLTDADFQNMIAAGLNCVYADPSLVPKFEAAGVFYWGTSAAELPFPECLYRPLYIGPALFLDEPAVHVRDSVLRPRFQEDAAFRNSVTPQDAMDAFETLYADAIKNGAPVQLMKALTARSDVDMGTMAFVQPNIYSWETMISSAAYELLYHPETPGAIVFEPPGRLGTRRTLPAFNMSYGCEIPVGGDNFFDIIIGFLRGAARVSGKEWGISIYGGFDRTESAEFISRAYELGSTRFFYWDSAMLACVPFNEVLTLTRHLSVNAQEYPHRDLDRLRGAGDVAILLPPGYNLGHVHMGKGMLWGVPEFNLERLNQEGISYRTVMGNFFTEIERCIRQGVAFDLLWDLPAVHAEQQGYREVVRIREDGTVEVEVEGDSILLDGPRTPERSFGKAPALEVTLAEHGTTAPCTIRVSAVVHSGSAPVYYAPLPDKNGVHQNALVLWEVYGPNDEDYSSRAPEVVATPAVSIDGGGWVAEATLNIEKAGHYRLRAATTDLAGRSTVVWKKLEIR